MKSFLSTSGGPGCGLLLAVTLIWFVFPPVAHGADEGRRSIEIYGFAQLDYIQDFDRVDPDWKATLRPSKIPTNEGDIGDDGEAIFSVRQSRFGVYAELPAGGDLIKTRFEFDLFGVGDDAGQTTFRLRHFYGEWRQILAGQTWSLFMDPDVFPNTIDYWGPAGMVFLRNPQIRWTPLTGKSRFAVALENPNSDIDTGELDDRLTDAGLDVQGVTRLPDLTAQYRLESDWGHFQASGILRQIAYESLGSADNEPKGEETGYGVGLSSNIKFLTRDRLILSLVAGRGIASYMNDGGTDLAPEDDKAKTVPLLGLVAWYDHWWNARWSSSVGYSSTEVDNTNQQEGDAFKKGEYAALNILHYPNEAMMIGAEYLWGQREDKDGASGTDQRIQFSFKYNFSSKF